MGNEASTDSGKKAASDYLETWATSGGNLRHYGDCRFFSLKICDCGLLRTWAAYAAEYPDEKLSEQWAIHSGKLDEIMVKELL